MAGITTGSSAGATRGAAANWRGYTLSAFRKGGETGEHSLGAIMTTGTESSFL